MFKTMVSEQLQTLGRPFGSRDIRGVVIFSDVPGGTEVYVEAEGLPQYQPAPPDGQPIGPHGFHIQRAWELPGGKSEDPFKGAGDH